MSSKRIGALKASARSALSGHYRPIVLATFLFLFLDFVSTGIPALLFPASNTGNTVLQYALSFLFTLLVTLIEAGYLTMLLSRLRGNKVAAGDLLYAFYHQADRYLLIFILPVVIRYALSVPGTLLGNVLGDRILGPKGTELTLQATAQYMVLLLGISLVLSLLTFLVLLPLCMIPYIAYDHPALTPKAVFAASRQLMRGQYLRYIWLNLSFIGIYLLAQITFQVGSLWTTPYVRATRSAFYLDLIGEEPYREMME